MGGVWSRGLRGRGRVRIYAWTDARLHDAVRGRLICLYLFQSGTAPWPCRLAAGAQRGFLRTRSVEILRAEGGWKAKCV